MDPLLSYLDFDSIARSVIVAVVVAAATAVVTIICRFKYCVHCSSLNPEFT